MLQVAELGRKSIPLQLESYYRFHNRYHFTDPNSRLLKEVILYFCNRSLDDIIKEYHRKAHILIEEPSGSGILIVKDYIMWRAFLVLFTYLIHIKGFQTIDPTDLFFTNTYMARGSKELVDLVKSLSHMGYKKLIILYSVCSRKSNTLSTASKIKLYTNFKLLKSSTYILSNFRSYRSFQNYICKKTGLHSYLKDYLPDKFRFIEYRFSK